MINSNRGGKKRSRPNFMHYPNLFHEGLRKTTKTSVKVAGLRTEIWTRDIPKYEAGVLTIRRRRLVSEVFYQMSYGFTVSQLIVNLSRERENNS
jgi:hypothetical protein